MQFTYTKNSARSEVFGLGSSPLRRGQSRKSIQKAVEATPRTRKNQGNQALNFASFGPDPNDPPLTIDGESQGFLSTQRTQRNATEALTEVKDMIESKEEGNLYSLEDGRETKMEFQKLQLIEFGITVVAVIGAALTVLSYDVEFSGEDKHFGRILLWVIFGSNKVCIVLTWMRYLQNLNFQKARNQILQKATLVSTGDIWYLILEIIVFLIQPYPFLQGIEVQEDDEFTGIHYYYHVNDFFCLLLVLRTYILGRFMLNSMMFRSPRSHRIGDMYGSDSGYVYAIRSIMKVHAEKAVPLLLCSSIMVFGYMIRICERPLNRNPTVDIEFNTYWNAMWCVILTMTTVGYGDVYARTMLGRTVSLFVCIWGTFVVSIMVVTLTGILTMSSPEEKSLMILRKLEARKRQKQEAAYILTNIAKMSLMRKKPLSKEKREDAIKESVSSLKRHLRTFRRTTREIKGLDGSTGAVEEVTRQIRFVGEDIQTLMQSQKELQKTISDLISNSVPMKYPGSIYVVPESMMSFKGNVDEDVVIQKTR